MFRGEAAGAQLAALRGAGDEEERMSTRGIVAIGLGVSSMLLSASAFAQVNPNAPPPGGEPSINVAVPTPPPADQPLIRKIPKPTFMVDAGAGVLGYLGGTGRPGPAWNVRVTADFTPRFAAEGNYVGSVNERADNTGRLTYTSVDADFRYNILRADEAPLQPYVSGGIGFANWIGPGGRALSLVLPVAAGVERMLTEHIKIGARFNLRPTFFDDLGHGTERNAPGGDSWSLVANVGGGF
ncbi:Hypothetical protein A7982_05708 [Minicystis rosea]|nr:Hypothetical protein A7982_05708 [Minicystis rosea]